MVKEVEVRQKCLTCGTKLIGGAMECAFCHSKDLAPIAPEVMWLRDYCKP